MRRMTSFVLAAITAIFVLAGFVKGMIGLGLPTVAMGLLALVMTPAQAAALLVHARRLSGSASSPARSCSAHIWPCVA